MDKLAPNLCDITTEFHLDNLQASALCLYIVPTYVNTRCLPSQRPCMEGVRRDD